MLCAMLIVSFSVPAMAETNISTGSVSAVYVNDKAIDFDVTPEIVNGRTFVPMRAIFEALGAEVTWSDSRKEAVAELGQNEVVLKISSKIGLHNADANKLEAAPYIKNERTMVPLRYLSEALGYEVKWDDSQRIIKINSKEVSDKTDKTSAKSILGNDTDFTYKSAQNRIVKVSPNMDSVKLSYEQAEQGRKEFMDIVGKEWTETQLQTKAQLDLVENWAEKMVVLTGQQQAYSVKTKMDELSLKLADLVQAKQELGFKQRALNLAKTQYEEGAIALNALTIAENDVKTAQSNISSIETEIEGLNIALYGSLQYDLGKYKEPEFKLEYKAIGSVNLDDKYRHEVNNDPYIWYLEHNKRNAKFNIDTYEFNNPMSEKSYDMSILSLKSAALNLQNTKANLKTTIYSRYNSIIQLENNIDKLYESLDEMRDTVDNLRTQYEYGAISKYNLEKARENESSIKGNILKLKVQHEQMREIFEKPYLAPEYMVS